MTASDWKIEVRDANLNRLGVIDDYQELQMTLKMNDVSTWKLVMNRRHRLMSALCTPGNGIIVTRGDDTDVTLSGFWTEQQHDRSRDRNTVTLSGVDDTAWLTRRLAHPQPDTADDGPPYSTSAGHVVTASHASTVIRTFISANAADTATANRRVPGLSVGADPSIGPTLTGTGRWQNLLTLLQELATSSEAGGTPLGFIIRQTGSILSAFVYPIVDASSTVRLSLEMGSLAAFSYRRTAPTSTFATVGGSGEGTARTIKEQADGTALAEWGRIEGEFVNSSGSDTAQELAQAAAKDLTDNGEKTSLSITPIDIDTQKYGIDYGLGYKVTAVLDQLGPDEGPGQAVVDIVREVNIDLTPDDEKITPSIGQGAKLNPSKLFATVKRLARRTTNLERV